MGVPVPHRSEDGPGEGPGAPRQLTREMSSRKLIALDFIKRYFARWGYSPTLGELAAGLGVSTKRAHDLVHQLAIERMVEVTAGKTRGIRLPDRREELSEADVLLSLAARGWTVAHGGLVLRPPEGPPESAAFPAELLGALMEKGLHDLPLLDHDPDLDGDTGTGIDEETPNNAGSAQRSPAAAGRAKSPE